MLVLVDQPLLQVALLARADLLVEAVLAELVLGLERVGSWWHNPFAMSSLPVIFCNQE